MAGRFSAQEKIQLLAQKERVLRRDMRRRRRDAELDRDRNDGNGSRGRDRSNRGPQKCTSRPPLSRQHQRAQTKCERSYRNNDEDVC